MSNYLHNLWWLLKRTLQSSPEDIAEQRGEESEERVFRIIMDMMIWDELPPREKGITPYRTEKWSDLDRNGVDIVVPTIQGDIHVQVKSSGAALLNFVHDSRNQDKVCVVGQADELFILKQLRSKLRIAYESLSSRS